ncbi:probable G-protein coupled receptor 148 [Hoplias malabaricus]
MESLKKLDAKLKIIVNSRVRDREMSNLTRAMDLPSELQTGLQNSSSSLENLQVLDSVKACVHSMAFMVTGLFTYLITVTVLGSPGLRQNPRYVLLCQHCVCISVFNISGAVLHCLRSLRWNVARITCWILFDLQVVMARSLIMTLTLMCLCTCLAICQPFQYPILIRRSFLWIMLLIWLLALVNPVVFTVMACTHQPWEYVIGLDAKCSTALEGKACITSSLLLLVVIVLLIISSYLLIYLEGRRAGHFSQSNSKGRQTILIHSLQMSFQILPAVIIITRLQQTLAVALATFLVFSIAQSLSPVVYGLRCRELQEELPRFLPHCLRGWINS